MCVMRSLTCHTAKEKPPPINSRAENIKFITRNERVNMEE